MSNGFAGGGTPMLDFALSYALYGWNVIPCFPIRDGICGCGRPQCVSPGKHPANGNGLSGASTEPEQIKAWWADVPDASIGVVMEPSGLVALDLDLYHKDLEKLAALERDLGPLPSTVTQRSGSGQGYHALFAAPGFPVRGVIGGIVVRSRAYIVVAPSNHASGDCYAWQGGLGPTEIPVATLPDRWLAALRKTSEVGSVGVPTEEPEWLTKIPAEQRLADMRAYFAKQPGEVKGTSNAGTTFNVVRSAIRAHAVRDSDAALEAAMEYDLKCIPPWGARMARHVWSAYQKAYEPVWGSSYRGEQQRLEALGLDAVPTTSNIPAPLAIVVRTTLEALASKRTNDPERRLDNTLIKDYLLPGQYLGDNEALAARALVRNCPPGTTDAQMIALLGACMVSNDRALELITTARAESAESLRDSLPLSDPSTDSAGSPDMELRKTLKLDTNKEGVQNRPSNLIAILSSDSALSGNIRFNVLTKEIEILSGRFSGVSGNVLPTLVMNWLDQKWQLVANKSHVEDQLALLARSNEYNPIQDYLDNLTWDQVPRIDSWLIDYCGAEPTEFNRRIGAMWLIGACARGIVPGSKVDTVLVLEGAQGIKKSTTLRILAGEWFSDSPVAIGTKDAMMTTSSRWIIELAELASLRKTETESQKSFLSTSVDTFRPPYGKVMETYPRFAVFGGSTNEDEYLPDTTGNRRYLPCRVGECDIARLAKDRDQLWAEAVYRYRSAVVHPELAHPQCPGERWWFETGEEQSMAASVVGKRQPENVWAGLVREWTRRTSTVGAKVRRQWTLAEIAKNALDLDIEKIPARQKAIVAALRDAGLVPTEGPTGQTMWRVKDEDVSEAVVAAAQGLQDSN